MQGGQVGQGGGQEGPEWGQDGHGGRQGGPGGDRVDREAGRGGLATMYVPLLYWLVRTYSACLLLFSYNQCAFSRCMVTGKWQCQVTWQGVGSRGRGGARRGWGRGGGRAGATASVLLLHANHH